jgi:nitroreductase
MSDLREVFEEAATAAGYAPSIHNTQPWHWRVRGESLELWAVPTRQLTATDVDGRMLTVSCGAALNHATVALAALGYPAVVERLPDPARPLLLARVTAGEYQSPQPQAMRHYQALAFRHTDRRPVTGDPVPPEQLDAIAEAVRGQGAHLHLLRREQVLDLAAAAAYAQATEDAEATLRAELDYWVGGERPTGAGVPTANLPVTVPATTVPERDFRHAGSLPVTDSHDRAASYGLLYTDRDDELGWLVAGEALSAGWLAATELGVSVLPLSAVIEVPTTRVRLRGMLTADSYPQLVVRLGNADPDVAGPRPTPRLAGTVTVDVDPD